MDFPALNHFYHLLPIKIFKKDKCRSSEYVNLIKIVLRWSCVNNNNKINAKLEYLKPLIIDSMHLQANCTWNENTMIKGLKNSNKLIINKLTQ